MTVQYKVFKNIYYKLMMPAGRIFMLSQKMLKLSGWIQLEVTAVKLWFCTVYGTLEFQALDANGYCSCI